MSCDLCNLYDNGVVFSECQYWKYIADGDRLIAVWYQHENLMNLSKCKRMAHDLQLRLQQEAIKYFKTPYVKVTPDFDLHVHAVATKIKDR